MVERTQLSLGQFYSPAPAVDLALGLVLGAPGAWVLDPTCGDGAFLARAMARGVPAERLIGIEVDPIAAAAARQRVPGAAVRVVDLFDVAASEIAADVIVGNPPYVRQERLDPDAKRRIRARLRDDWPQMEERDAALLTGRGDLAAACIARALRMLRPGGRAALIVSTALFDADYARPLWRLMAREAQVELVVEAATERWFEAAVNTCILVFRRDRADDRGDDRAVRLARLDRSTDHCAARIAAGGAIDEVATVRTAATDAPETWATQLRAPDAWFELADVAGGALVPLGELAVLRRGVTSGANDFFYLGRDAARSHGIEEACLVPVLRSPRGDEGGRILFDPGAATRLALCVPPQALGQHPGAARYIADHAHVADRPTLRARSPWWSLPSRPSRVFLTKAYDGRFVQRLSRQPVIADQRLYALWPRVGVDASALAAVLNSTFTALALEALGRSSMGEGALEWTVSDARTLPVLDPRRAESGALAAALEPLLAREIGRVGAEADRLDRRDLDRAVAADADIAALLPAVHAALIAAVEARRARSRAGHEAPG